MTRSPSPTAIAGKLARIVRETGVSAVVKVGEVEITVNPPPKPGEAAKLAIVEDIRL